MYYKQSIYVSATFRFRSEIMLIYTFCNPVKRILDKCTVDRKLRKFWLWAYLKCTSINLKLGNNIVVCIINHISHFSDVSTAVIRCWTDLMYSISWYDKNWWNHKSTYTIEMYSTSIIFLECYLNKSCHEYVRLSEWFCNSWFFIFHECTLCYLYNFPRLCIQWNTMLIYLSLNCTLTCNDNVAYSHKANRLPDQINRK